MAKKKNKESIGPLTQENLYDRYMRLRAIDLVPVRDRIIKECDITIAVWRNWYKGVTEVKKPQLAIIENIFKEYQDSYINEAVNNI